MKVLLLCTLLVPLVFGEDDNGGHEQEEETPVTYAHINWKAAAEYLQSAMDFSVDPCVNFYEHVCGNFKSSEEGNYETTNDELLSSTMWHLEHALEQFKPDDPNLQPFKRDVISAYTKCVESNRDSKEQTKQMYEAVSKRIGPLPVFGPVPQDFNVWRMLGILKREGGVNLGIESDLGLGTVVVYREEAVGSFDETRAWNIISALATALGQNIDTNKTKELLSRTATFFDHLRSIHSKINSADSINYKASEALSKFPYLRQYLSGLLGEKLLTDWLATNATITTDSTELLDAMDAIANPANHKPDEWLTFAYMRFLKKFSEASMGEPTSDNSTHAASRKHQCLNFVTRAIPAAAARLYFDHVHEDISRWRSDIQMLAYNVLSAFRLMLNSVLWLDDEEKVKINKKIDLITFYPGVPQWITNDQEIYARTHFLAENQAASMYEKLVLAQEQRFDRDATNQLVRHLKEDPDPDFEINAFFNPGTSSIAVNFGFVVPPAYMATYPLSVKYGGLGTTIAHELAHAFDAGNLKMKVLPEPYTTLKNATLEQFDRWAKCLERQYSQYCYKHKNTCIDGFLTLSENIVDIDGIKAGYLAYKYVSDLEGGDVPLGTMANYTSDQVFFLAAVRQFCAKNEPGEAAFKDVHTPDRPRMEVGVKNIPQFATAFQCPPSSNALAAKPCPIWGDFNLLPEYRRMIKARTV